MCLHPEEAIMTSLQTENGNRVVRYRCLDCDMVIFQEPYVPNGCRHAEFLRRGTNQFGPRLRCAHCNVLLLRNTLGTARYLPIP